MDSLIEAARRPLVDIAPEIAGALVLLDAGAAEVAQLSLGPAFLLARAHRKTPRPQVFPSAARVTICCALSELAHAQQAGVELGVEGYREYAGALQQDLAEARAAAGLPPHGEGAPPPQISVRHVPLHLAALDAATFVLPAGGAAAGAAM
ncbi:hypothetical protein Rsub_01828 [Raphidocelis subcapitata]|uniref:Uncharacterized protein n=1 Tax=Raphidocelis subcapitata TaxID=307507 RepID=A0A2V0NNG2_9CHLO|nr:hypothetical protein Rsub_01828 [Raphidocelis subcapitata]|eukprot:GBF89111.1 hypothetical protein Rsub_01828 [Raphidocelis subcapitata]